MTDSFIKPELLPIQALQEQIAAAAQDREGAIDTLQSAGGLVGPRDQVDEVGAMIVAAGLGGAVVGNRVVDQLISANVEGAADVMRRAQQGA